MRNASGGTRSPDADPPAPPPDSDPPPARATTAPRSPRAWPTTVASVAGGLLLWQLIGQFAVGNALFLATPVQAAQELIELARDGQLWRDMWVSGQEFVLGFVFASLGGIILGLAMATSRRLSLILSPWVSGLYATPIVALAPLLILWFGIGAASKVAVVFALVIFPVTINVEAGIRSTDADLIEAARAFGASKREVFQKISLPSAMPYILAGLRLGIGRGLIGVVVGELFGARAGLGHLINNAAQVFNMPQLFAGIAMFAFAGIVLTAAFRRLEKRVLHWQ